jgi:hypothetical protein
VPTGNTNFQFKAGGLRFKSSSYDWLVVSGQDKAKYGMMSAPLSARGEAKR